MNPPPSARVLVTGSTGSGKTSVLRALFLPRFPRVIVLDFLGTEWQHYIRPEMTATTVGQLLTLLRRVRRESRWTILCQWPEDSPATAWLVNFLQPVAGRPSFVAAVGGICLYNDEIDLLAPAGSATPEVKTLWSRGRHVGLSILAASQRLPHIHRVVSAQSQFLGICQQHEPRDLDAVARYIPPGILGEATGLAPFDCLIWEPGAQRGQIVRPAPGGDYSGRYHVVRKLGSGLDK